MALSSYPSIKRFVFKNFIHPSRCETIRVSIIRVSYSLHSDFFFLWIRMHYFFYLRFSSRSSNREADSLKDEWAVREIGLKMKLTDKRKKDRARPKNHDDKKEWHVHFKDLKTEWPLLKVNSGDFGKIMGSNFTVDKITIHKILDFLYSMKEG